MRARLLPNSALLLGVMLVGSLPACKKSTVATVSHTRGAGAPDTSALEANGCIASARQSMLRATPPDLSDAAASQTLAASQSLFNGSSEIYTSYGRDGTSPNYTGLRLAHYLQSGANTADVEYVLAIATPSSSAASTASYLTFQQTTKLRSQQQLTLYSIKQWRIDGASGCPRTLMIDSLATFAAAVDRSVQMHYLSTNLQTGQVISSFTKAVDPALLANEAAYNADHSGLTGIGQSRTVHVFGSPNVPEMTIVFTRNGTMQGLDPTTNANVTLQQFNVAMTAGTGSVQGTAVASPASVYEADTVFNSTSETITLPLFQATALKTESTSQLPVMVGFNDGDFADPALTYAYGYVTPLAFDNFAPYFNMSGLQPAEVPAGAPSDTWQKVANVQRSLAPELDKAFTPAPAGSDFLAETYYIDYSDPAVQALSNSVRSQMGASPTNHEVLQLILNAVVGSIQYDHDSVNNDAITVMRASDALKSHKGVCQHFAALFVALARSVGMPARVVDGYYLEKNSNQAADAGPHAWVEAKLSGTLWLPLEPQTSQFLFLPGPNYLPVIVDRGYEQVGGNTDLGYNIARSQAMTHLYLSRLPDVGSANGVANLGSNGGTNFGNGGVAAPGSNGGISNVQAPPTDPIAGTPPLGMVPNDQNGSNPPLPNTSN